MKPFKTYLSENLSDEERNKLIAHHTELANVHAEKSRFHKNKPLGPNSMDHSMAANGHNDAARDHSYAASSYKMKLDDQARYHANSAKRTSQSADNRSKTIE